MVQMYFDRDRPERHDDPMKWDEGMARKNQLHSADARDRREQQPRPVHLLAAFCNCWIRRVKPSRNGSAYRGKAPGIIIERCGLDPHEKLELRPDDTVWGKTVSGAWIQLHPQPT